MKSIYTQGAAAEVRGYKLVNSTFTGISSQPLPGVVELSLADNVCTPLGRDTHARVTVTAFRYLILNDAGGVSNDPVFHRLALKAMGRCFVGCSHNERLHLRVSRCTLKDIKDS